MLDESSNIKNDKSKQSKFILGLRPTNVILLSGTPISGKYEELWSQCKLLGWNITKTAFLKRYTIQHWNPILSFYEIKGYQNIEELKDKLRSYGAVFMKTSEVFDLPKQNFIDVDCKTTPNYVTFNRDHYLVRDGKELIGDTATTARLILRQLAGVWNANKLARVTELIESTNDRIIIFYNFNLELEALRAIAHKLKRPISLVNGATKDLSAFENADNSVTLIQYQAGSMGLNLQKANKMIYFTPPQSAEFWMQSQKRIHRIGQEKPCFYYRMITNDSIDGHIYAALERGENYTDELFKKELFKNGGTKRSKSI